MVNPQILRMSPLSGSEKICRTQKIDERQDHVSRWVEQATRFTRSSSYTDMSGSCGDSDTTDYTDSVSVSPENVTSSPEYHTDTTLTEEEVQIITSTYWSYKTHVHVSPGLVNLYTSQGESSSWVLQYTGVPALLLNMGGTRARKVRQVTILLAERGTGFTLWKDRLDNLSSYRGEEMLFHTLHSSSDHRLRVGFSWDSEELASAFLSRVQRLTSTPENLGLSGPKKKEEEDVTKKRNQEERRRRMDKRQISSPCGFRHNVSVSLEDFSTHFSLQLYLPKKEEQEHF